MSLTEPSQDLDEPEGPLQDHNGPNEPDKTTRTRDFCTTVQADRRTISPLGLLKEDFNQFKEEVLKVFKDRDTKTEPGDGPRGRGPLGLLKQDLHQFKEDITNVFSIGSSKETTFSEQAINRPGSLKEDFSLCKDDLSNVFRLLKGRDVAKEDSSNAFKPRSCRTDRTEEPLRSLFRRSGSVRPAPVFTEHSAGVNSVSEHLAKQRRGGGAYSGATPGPRRKHGEEEEEKEVAHWVSLSSGVSLLDLRDDRKVPPGDELWSLKNFACYLTFDPNTANSELCLTDDNRKATRVWSDHRPSGHPDRFQRCPQVLCREGLLDSVYWEVVWSGGADVGVTYNGIPRDGDTASSLLGHNALSWVLECSEGSYTPCHHNKRFRSYSPRPFSRRVGVYLDWPAGSLSFYCISKDAMVHLHTFTSTFTEPLYPAFWVWAYDSSVSLCHVELDWERLLQ